MTWQPVSLGVNLPYSSGIVGVSSAGKVAYMYLDNAYYSSDDGQTWTHKPSGFPGHFCQFLDENTIAVTTSTGGSTVLSFDGGDTWGEAIEDFSGIPFVKIERAPDGSIFGLFSQKMYKWMGGNKFKSYISTTGINPLVAVWDFAISPDNRIYYSCDVVGSNKMDVYWAPTTDPTNIKLANSFYRPDLGPLRQMFFHDGKLHGLTVENVMDRYHRFEPDGSSVGISTAPGFGYSLDGWAIHPTNGRIISFPNDMSEHQTRRRF